MPLNFERDGRVRRTLARARLIAAALVSLSFGVGAMGCDTRDDVRATAPGPRDAAAPQPQTDDRPRVVVLGDSLTAGLGLPREDAYPSLLQRRLDEAGLPLQVVNAGVSGDTSAGGLRRLDWALEGDVRVLVLALGANDGLRGLPPAELQRNLTAIVERARARGADVVLAGMEAPPNFGAAYTAAFRRVYRELAARYRLALVPFLLDGVAGVERLNQRDGLHPTAAGARRIADNVWPVLRPVIERAVRLEPARPATS
jgi:acyl-CoA thioesterase-1